MASGFGAPAPTVRVTVTTAPATVPRNAVTAVDSLDGLGGGFRSRRLRAAAERAAVFFLAVLFVFFFVFLFVGGFRDLRCAALFATLTSAASACTLGATRFTTDIMHRPGIER